LVNDPSPMEVIPHGITRAPDGAVVCHPFIATLLPDQLNVIDAGSHIA
jgi:hypothetical protein